MRKRREEWWCFLNFSPIYMNSLGRMKVFIDSDLSPPVSLLDIYFGDRFFIGGVGSVV